MNSDVNVCSNFVPEEWGRRGAQWAELANFVQNRNI